jgi:uncharacterized protein (AIM24 family)
MPEQSIDAFVQANADQDGSPEHFALETTELLAVNLQAEKAAPRTWGRLGAMIAYTGQVDFERESALEGGIAKFFKKQFTDEGAPLMFMQGDGRVFLADKKKKVSTFNLSGERVSVNGNDLLAFSGGIDWDIEPIKSSGGMVAGGLFNVELAGTGVVAITSHGKPLTLPVERGAPVFTDPQATVAWSGSLAPQIESNVSFKSLIGRGSEETVQYRFDGDGWVLVQPFEEAPSHQQKQGSGQGSR